MSGMWKRSYGCASEAPPDERGGKQICPAYRHRATSRLYQMRPQRASAISDRPPPTNPTVMPHRLALFDFIIEIEMTAVFDR